MTQEVHPVVKDTADLDDPLFVAAVQNKMPPASAVTSYMQSAEARRNFVPSL
jgi:hypothetical protein